MTSEARIATERAALALFDDLLDIRETKRAAWIAERTADPDVKARLHAMLEADRIATLGTGAAALGLGGPVPLPDRIGQYRITGLIGRGGMGAVYSGNRDTGDFAHQAAIKVIKPGLLSDVLTARFLAERQTLAGLSHPNIARLFDGGATPDGAPYIVMELVEGVPVDRWADAQRLDVAARLQLVETAADAVSHAHQRLVIHRDITPLNVLVTDDGLLKLIDFGIARSADGDVTTATDIHGLGRLLTRLVPTPNAELAAVIARATDANPARRYPSADALAADLRAWRAGHPVAAVAGGRRYAIRKFAGRHRLGVAASAAVLVMLLAALASILFANRQARLAEAEAEARFAQTRGIARAMLFPVYDAVSKVSGSTDARATLATTAMTYLDALAAMRGAPADVRVEAGRGYVRLAEVTGGGQAAQMGKLADANQLLARAEALLAPAYAATPGDRATALAYAALRVEQAATNLYNNNDAPRALSQAQAAEKTARALATTDAEAARLFMAALHLQGDSFGWRDDYAGALPFFVRTEVFAAALSRTLQDDVKVMATRAANLRLLAEAEHKLKNARAARAALDRAIAINRQLLTNAPNDPERLRKLSTALWYSAVVHRTNNQNGAALLAIGEATALSEQLARRDPSDAGALKMVALTHEVAAQIAADTGDRAGNKAAAEASMAAHRRLVQLAGNAPGAVRSMAASMRTQSGNLYNLGDVAAACRQFAATLALYDRLAARGELTEIDRKNGRPELIGYVRDICVGGQRPKEL